MEDTNGTAEGAQTGEKIATVASAVLTTFFDELAKFDDLEEIAAGLKKLVLEDGVFAEPSIRAVLFPDAP